MTLTDSQLKGNWGEQFIASELAAKGCLVRHVTQGHDTGVDLYCETTWNGSPFLHFWCQVKTRKILGRRKTYSYKPPKKEQRHIAYWVKQPVPVFIFVVPSFLRDQQISKPYYICTPLQIKNGAMLSFLKVGNTNTLHRFLYDSLVDMSQQWAAKDGRLDPIKRPDHQDSFIGFERGITLPFKRELLRSIRWGLWRLVDDTLFLGERREESRMFNGLNPLSPEGKNRVREVKPYINALKSLCKENEASHWESYYVIGQYYELEKEFDEALRYYEKALAILGPIAKGYPATGGYSEHQREITKAIDRVKDLMAPES